MMKRCTVVLFTLVLAITLTATSTDIATARTRTWTTMESAGSGGESQLPAGSDILAFDVAVDNQTIFVGVGNRVFRSRNGGLNFDEPRTVADGITIVEIAISPDYASDKTTFIASEHNVYRSTDDGNSWFPFTAATASIRDPARDADGNAIVTGLDVAIDASGNLDVIVGTRDPTAGEFGEVLLYRSSTGTWDDRNVAAGGVVNSWEVIEVAFSPKYQSDGVKFAVVTTDNLAVPAQVVARFSDAEWGTNWFDSTAIGTAGAFISADLAFPADFDVITPGRTYYFLGMVNTIATQGDVFRITGRGPGSGLTSSEVRELDLNEGIYSVTFSGSLQGGTLLAGASAMARVWHTADTMASQPVWNPAIKSPFGQGNTIVRASTDGSTMWASTQGANGGFHVSTDSSYAFDGAGGGPASEVTPTGPDDSAALPATFTTTDLTISPAEVGTGENVTISVMVANTGDLSGRYEVILMVDGVAIATHSDTLSGGASETVNFTTSKGAPGTYSVNINDLTGEFTVREAVVPPPSPAPPTPLPTPPAPPVPEPPSPPPQPVNWWLIGAIVIGLVVIGLILYVRRQRRRALE